MRELDPEYDLRQTGLLWKQPRLDRELISKASQEREREGKNDDLSSIRGQLTLMMERFCQGAKSDSMARLEQCWEESYGEFT